MNDERCRNYCGVACVDGSCPIANEEEYVNEGRRSSNFCNECWYFRGCEDCYFSTLDNKCDIENVLKGKRSD